MGSVRFRFSRLLIVRRKVSHIRAPRHKNVPSALTAKDEPEEFAVKEENDRGHDPGEGLRHRRVH